mgnify:CR=1 FL=1
MKNTKSQLVKNFHRPANRDFSVSHGNEPRYLTDQKIEYA